MHADKIRDGFVVESIGKYFLIAVNNNNKVEMRVVLLNHKIDYIQLKSPVSATIIVCFFKWSNVDDMVV